MTIFLVFSLLALLVGPGLFALAHGRRGLPPVLDWAVVLSITALVLLEWAEGFEQASPFLLIPLGLTGLFGPTLVEWFLHRVDYHTIEARTHLVTLGLGILGVAIHAFLDGAALSVEPVNGNNLLPAAVALHRVPVSMALWWLLQPAFGTRVAWSALALMGIATLVGVVFAPHVLGDASSQAGLAFRAFVSGSLLHVVFFRAHTHRHDHAD